MNDVAHISYRAYKPGATTRGTFDRDHFAEINTALGHLSAICTLLTWTSSSRIAEIDSESVSITLAAVGELCGCINNSVFESLHELESERKPKPEDRQGVLGRKPAG